MLVNQIRRTIDHFLRLRYGPSDGEHICLSAYKKSRISEVPEMRLLTQSSKTLLFVCYKCATNYYVGCELLRVLQLLCGYVLLSALGLLQWSFTSDNCCIGLRCTYIADLSHFVVLSDSVAAIHTNVGQKRAI
ncbi:hypothetical protein D3C76_269080 [compost metagenome]